MLVSIIIPCYNVQKYITECLDSVYSQIYSNIEVICIDNNSTDHTLQTIEKLKEKHPDLILLSEPKPGASAARNRGLLHAKGDWIQFLDADDLLMPNKIVHQVGFLSSNNKSIPFIASPSFKQNTKGEKRIHLTESNPWKGVFSTNLGITSANLFFREALEKVGAWDTEIKSSQEYDLMFRLLKKFDPPIIDSEPLTIIRERESGQISQRNPKEKWKQYLELRIEMIVYLKEHQKEEWKNNYEYYLNKFFSKLRLYAREDLTGALIIFKKIFPLNFIPQKSIYVSNLYIVLFRVLGFEYIEKIRSGIFDNRKIKAR